MTCKDCPDFDLCFLCFSCDEHGHHPGHRFEPVATDTMKVTPRMMNLCGAGRGVVHQAICDGCDKVKLLCRMKSCALLKLATRTSLECDTSASNALTGTSARHAFLALIKFTQVIDSQLCMSPSPTSALELRSTAESIVTVLCVPTDAASRT